MHACKKREQALLNDAEHCERVGRYKDAAEYYEELANEYEQRELYDKAWEMRNMARQLLHGKKQVVIVDLNKLLEQVKDGGIVVVYRCPHCGGKLEIGKGASVESLEVCKYCGSEIKAMDLADFLRTALS
jgi:DNA-directed RNA polymerase subunit RPC12/RpoP